MADVIAKLFPGAWEVLSTPWLPMGISTYSMLSIFVYIAMASYITDLIASTLFGHPNDDAQEELAKYNRLRRIH